MGKRYGRTCSQQPGIATFASFPKGRIVAPSMDFQGKNVVLAGGSSGIGASLLETLSGNGAEVTTLGRRPVEGTAAHISFDAESGDEIEGLPEAIHGLAYCPGTITLKPFHRLSEDDFLRDFRVNLLGAVKVLQAALPGMKKAGSASVVLFSTVAVGTGLGFHASIASAKGAVEGLARSLACEWAPNIRVNVIAPSLTNTPLASSLLGSEEKREASEKRHPLKAVGDPSDVAGLAAFLLGDESKFISGQVLRPDGGLSSLRPL